MNYNIPPPGRLRFSAQYRWLAGQSTLSPLRIESITDNPSNSSEISSNISSENLNSDESEKNHNKLNVSVENEKFSSLSETDNPINIPLASDVSFTTSMIMENSEDLSRPER